MKTRIARLALAGGIAAFAFAPAAPASASCGPVVDVACAVVCTVPSEPVYRLCTIV
jgi:hypothetical protein